MGRVVVIALLAGLTVSVTATAGPGTGEGSPAGRTVDAESKNRAPLTTTAAIRRARRFAKSRQGVVAFAVVDERHRPRGLRRTSAFPSASVSKAMLLVAALRRAGGRRLSKVQRHRLRAMVTLSDNDAASAVYAELGGGALERVARAARMNKFADVGHWAGAQITAADQARFFLRVDRLIPPAHRRYARKLLSSIVREQRWGIAPVARRKHMKIFFKGGWRAGITHQVALLERRGRRVALAVLTSGSPSMTYGQETIERIAARILH